MEHKQTQAKRVATLPPAIVIRGLPGIGKTTLANEVAAQLKDEGFPTFHVNADAVRESVNKGLGFTLEDRIENARRIGALVWLAQTNGYIPVVDFVMPNKATFDAFWSGVSNSRFLLFSLRPSAEFKSRFPDTVKMYERVQEWWAGAVIDKSQIMNEIDPYPESETTTVASQIVLEYIRQPHLKK